MSADAQVPGSGLPDCPAAMQAQGLACVVVQVVGGGASSNVAYSTNQVRDDAPDVLATTYDVPGTSGVRVDKGTSVGRLVDETLSGQGVDPSRVTFVEVDGPDSFGRHPLTPTELRAPGDSGQAPTIYATSNNLNLMSYIRAERTSGDDQSASGPGYGFFDSARGGSLQIVVHLSGRLLDPTVTATPVPGSDRSFTVSCTGCGAGLTTTWVFPDGTTSSDPSPTYTFGPGDRAGSYPISVAVEDPSDGSFGAAQTFVQIGAAPSASASPSTPGTGGTGHGHHGSTHGTPSQSANPHPGHGHGGSATASPSASSRPSAQPSGVPTLPPVLPTVQSSSSLYVPATDGPLSVPSTQAPTATPTPTATDGSAAAPVGSDVQGVLLTAGEVNAPSPGGQILDVPAPSLAAGPAVDPPLRVDPLVWLGLGGVVLLAAGAASESDRLRRRLRRWARIGG